MEFITVLNLIIGVVDFFDALYRRLVEGRAYRIARFGYLGEIFYWFQILPTEDIQRLHYNINLWTKEQALAWRDSYVSRCSAISVAAAIFASVGQSALSLDGMTDVHWSASALLTASMVLGILSVCAAVSLQNAVTSLSGHTEIRLWLSRGLSDWTRYDDLYAKLPLESSAATVKLSGCPGLFLNLSIICYFLGFGLYLLYGWKWDVEPTLRLRNNFIFYTAVIGAIVVYVAVLWTGRIVDGDKVNQQLNLKRRYDTGEVDAKRELLERWVSVVEILTDDSDDAGKARARKELEEILWALKFGTAPPTKHEKSETTAKIPEQSNTLTDV